MLYSVHKKRPGSLRVFLLAERYFFFGMYKSVMVPS
jgi:hypothetical protein